MWQERLLVILIEARKKKKQQEVIETQPFLSGELSPVLYHPSTRFHPLKVPYLPTASQAGDQAFNVRDSNYSGASGPH